MIVQAFLDNYKKTNFDDFRLLLQILVYGTGNQESFSGLEQGWLNKKFFNGTSNFDGKLVWIA